MNRPLKTKKTTEFVSHKGKNKVLLFSYEKKACEDAGRYKPREFLNQSEKGEKCPQEN